uniref:Uncharacterized protein n=1 Tax=Hyaloperonospora arabidopsidis (strain Emoy2) TaxID=559515 RepID=M4B5X2_HYAAE
MGYQVISQTVPKFETMGSRSEHRYGHQTWLSSHRRQPRRNGYWKRPASGTWDQDRFPRAGCTME